MAIALVASGFCSLLWRGLPLCGSGLFSRAGGLGRRHPFGSHHCLRAPALYTAEFGLAIPFFQYSQAISLAEGTMQRLIRVVMPLLVGCLGVWLGHGRQLCPVWSLLRFDRQCRGCGWVPHDPYDGNTRLSAGLECSLGFHCRGVGYAHPPQ